MLNGQTRLYPIIGDPIVYVKSPERLSASFAAAGHNGLCVPMQVPKGDLDTAIRGLSRIANIDGLLVTMPHKFAAFAYCATSSTTAQRLGVVSVMRRNSDGSWHGDMLDGFAFVKAQIDAGAVLDEARVLLVGAGGAGGAIAIAMLASGVRELVISDIDQGRVAKLIALLPNDIPARVSAGPADPTGFDVVCNATPMGMAAGDPLPVPAQLLKAPLFVGDVIAGHGETEFIRAARLNGCKTAGGDQMVEAVQQMMVEFMLDGRRA